MCTSYYAVPRAECGECEHRSRYSNAKYGHACYHPGRNGLNPVIRAEVVPGGEFPDTSNYKPCPLLKKILPIKEKDVG